jgi:DNA polymerase-3 subunit gamma/tau
MPYEVLARKWRPQSFEDMVGQAHVLRTLVNGLNNDRLHHAYLFTGMRGVGKTTLARILAKCLNCETGVTAKPCGKCVTCEGIVSGNYIDLIEVDAASKTGIDDTRDMLDNAQYAPALGRFKIYLIDEVHQLSGHSFNALLKTLEEPPAHVKFLLATTDPKKVPVTVLSRCLQFNLKSLSIDLVIKQLEHILQEDNIKYEDDALFQIARASEGSMRDALSLLDQAISYGQEQILSQDMSEMLDSVPKEHFSDLIKAISTTNATQALSTINTMHEHSINFNQLLDDLISILHHATVVQMVPSAINEFNYEKRLIELLNANIKLETLHLYYQIAIQGRREVSLAVDEKSGFEMLLLKMLYFIPFDEANTVYAEKNTLAGTVSKNDDNQVLSNEVASEMPLKGLNTANDWKKLVPNLKLNGIALALADNSSFIKCEEQVLAIAIDESHESIATEKAKTALRDSIKKYFKREMQLEVKTTNSDNHMHVTRRQLKDNQDAKQQYEAEKSVNRDILGQELKEKFGAEVIPGSIKPVK